MPKRSPEANARDVEKFKKLATKYLTCKEIAKEFGISPGCLGVKIFKLMGVYPSVYIARLKHGKTAHSLARRR